MGNNSASKRALCLLCCFVMILTLTHFTHATDDTLTGRCTYKVSEGKIVYLTDGDVKTQWRPKSGESYVKVTLPKNKKTDGVYIKWYSTDTPFAIRAYDDEGKRIVKIVPGEYCDGLECFYPLPESTSYFSIKISVGQTDSRQYGICDLTVAEKDTPKDHTGREWSKSLDKVDALVVATHQDDEFVFMGGILPYLIDSGKTVQLAYAATCGRRRCDDGLNGLWTVGLRSCPDFLNFPDKHRTRSIEKTKAIWDDEYYVIGKFVELIRKRKPEIIISHDVNGEKTHGAHMYVAYALQKAVVYAADESKYPESAAQYGTWQTKKLYLHLYEENRIKLDYFTPLRSYGGKTAYEVACEGFDCHTTEHDRYGINIGGKYDSAVFGLAYSTVGYDAEGLFYNTDSENKEEKSVSAERQQ